MKSRSGTWIVALCTVFALLLTAAPLWALPIAGAVFPEDSHVNDFTAAVVDKYDRLNSLEGRKIVFVGGSSLPFGLRSSLIEEELGYEVVDFGVYAALGTVVMMDLSLSGIKEGDVVVLAPETDPQLYSDYYDPCLFREAIGERTDLLASLSKGRRRKTALAYYPALYERMRDRNNPTVPESELYARSSFDEWGDIAVERVRNRMAEGYDQSKIVDLYTLFDRGFFDEVNDYAKKVREKGATLLFWFSPINAAAADFVDADADYFTERLSEELDCPLLGSVSDTVYDPAYFYDTNYHLNDAGSYLHTATTILKLQEYFGWEIGVDFEIPSPPLAQYQLGSDGTFLYRCSNWGDATIEGVEEEVLRVASTLTIPEFYGDYRVNQLRSECFAGCKNLTSLVIPDWIQTIGSDVFRDCPNLTEIWIRSTSPSELVVPDSGLFDGASPSLKVYIPRSAYHAFCANYIWGNYEEYFVAYDPE